MKSNFFRGQVREGVDLKFPQEKCFRNWTIQSLRRLPLYACHVTTDVTMAQLSSPSPFFYLCQVYGITMPLFRYCLLTFSIPFCSDLQAHIGTDLTFAESTLSSLNGKNWVKRNRSSYKSVSEHRWRASLSEFQERNLSHILWWLNLSGN